MLALECPLAATDKDLGKISPSARCMEVVPSIRFTMPGYSKHLQVHNSFKVQTKIRSFLMMMLTLKTLLTFSPLEMSPVPGENSSNTMNLYCFPAGMFWKRKIRMQNKPDHMLLEIRSKLPRDFCRLTWDCIAKAKPNLLLHGCLLRISMRISEVRNAGQPLLP